MNELISIVVPVYNVENYIDRCVTSIVNQTYSNIEIILVDDGSTDSSSLKCDNWKQKDSRIKVIHKKNGGLSDARNAGVKEVTGEYVCFVDSDDWISKSFVEILYRVAFETNSDIVECQKEIASEYTECKDNYGNKSINIKTYYDKDCFYEFFKYINFCQVVWNKIYSVKLIKNVTFRYGKINEDEFWTYLIFSRANIVSSIDYIGYFYFRRTNSIMNQNFSIKRLDAFEALVERFDFIEENYPELSEENCHKLLLSCIHFYCLIFASSIENKNIYLKKMMSYFTKYMKIANLKIVRKKRIVLYYFFLVCPVGLALINKKYHLI